MRVYYFLSFLIVLFLLSTGVSAKEWEDIEYQANSGMYFYFPDFGFSLPYLLKNIGDSCNTPSCEDFEIISNNNASVPYRLIDLDGDGFPENYLMLSRGWEDPENFTFKRVPPVVTLGNDILVNELNGCYKKYDKAICQNIKTRINDGVTNFRINFIPYSVKGRFDLYSRSINFTLSKDIEYFCPLVLNLSNWPRLNFLIITQKDYVNRTDRLLIKSLTTAIENNTYYSGSCINAPEESNITCYYYGGSLILLGDNKSVIVTKPSLNFGYPSKEYFFKTEVVSDDVLASVCTNKKNEYLVLPEGPNAYFLLGKPNVTELTMMSFFLENPPPPQIIPPNALDAKLLIRPSITPLEVTKPSISPRITFTSNEPVLFMNISWVGDDGVSKSTLVNNEDGEFVFENQNILLNGCRICFPFESYVARLDIDPPYIAPKTTDISLNTEDKKNYVGVANFDYEKVELVIKTNRIVQFWYFLSLFIFIVSIHLLSNYIANMKRDSFQPRNLLIILLSVFVVLIELSRSVVGYNLWSIGSIPFGASLLWISYRFLKKRRGVLGNIPSNNHD